MKKKFKLGQKVIFVKSNVPYSEDFGVMQKYEGCEGVIIDSGDNIFDYSITIIDVNETFRANEEEIVEVNTLTKVLYGLSRRL